jgi:hypothetical protein
MLSDPLRARLGVFLSAVLLISGSGLVSFEHSHVRGNLPHDHDVALARQHHGHHDHDHNTFDSLVQPIVSHVHWSLFGFDFSLPKESSEHGDQSDEHPVLYVMNQASWTFTTAPSHSVADLPIANALDPFLMADPTDFHGDAPQVSAPPLCAKARHERSGVQLA